MQHEPIHREALREAIKLMGSQEALAAKLGKKQGHVSFWLREAKKLPPEIAIQIERATEGKVARHRLCPVLGEN